MTERENKELKMKKRNSKNGKGRKRGKCNKKLKMEGLFENQ
jgi:hypothetical protein